LPPPATVYFDCTPRDETLLTHHGHEQIANLFNCWTLVRLRL